MPRPPFPKNVREFQSGSLDQSISEVPQPSLNEEPLSNKDETTIPLRTSINSRCDFSSEAGRNDALMSYTVHWTCSEASLARTARVDPADLSKWKRGNLPNESDKKNRIESAIEKNERPSPLPARPNY